MHTATSAEVMVLDDEAGIVRTRVDWLRRLNDPTATPPWGSGLTSVALIDVLGAAPCPEHLTPRPGDPLRRQPCAGCDLASIKFFYDSPTNEWTRYAPRPVVVDVGAFDYTPAWAITDGNHRLAAAILRNEVTLDVEVAGDWDRAIATLVHGIPLPDATNDREGPLL